MDLKYFLAQFQFCYSVHKKIRNGQRRVFAGAGAGDVSAMIRSTKARSSVRVSSVLLLPGLLSSSQGSTLLCPIILCFTNKCSQSMVPFTSNWTQWISGYSMDTAVLWSTRVLDEIQHYGFSICMISNLLSILTLKTRNLLNHQAELTQ